MKLKKRYDPRNRWSAKYRKDEKLWIATRKISYLYWFKFLQLAEKDPNRKVDWRKYKLWGGKKVVMETKFDDWWKEYWIDCFGIKNEGDTPKYPLTTKRPKTDAIRYALRLYENRHRGSTWDIAIYLKKNEKRMYFLEFFGKIDENMKTKTRLSGDNPRRKIFDEEHHTNVKWVGGKSENQYDDDSEAYLNRLQKKEVQSAVGRYLKKAEEYLDSVCEGKFP
tara:strand:- start:1172 stop:1837 length:666 start_codon:yes stop_codon:yes gene_type:complete